MGAFEAEPGASLRSKFWLGCLAQLGQELGCMCSGTCFPAVGQEEEEDQEGKGLSAITWGCCRAWRPVQPPGWGWCCVGSEATFTTQGTL